MHQKLLLVIAALLFGLALEAQDSLYYFRNWSPDALFRNAGALQEGVYQHKLNKSGQADSVLRQVIFYDSLGRVKIKQGYHGTKAYVKFAYSYTNNRLDSMIQTEAWLPAEVVHKYKYNDTGDLVLVESFNKGVKTMQTRYLYNQFHQPVEQFTKYDKGKEFLSARYTYRPDQLIAQVDVLFEKGRDEPYSYFYFYGNNKRTVTCYVQKLNGKRRSIAYISHYDNMGRLVEKLYPPFGRNAWLPADVPPRTTELTETYTYFSNGLLKERRSVSNEKLVDVESHIYIIKDFGMLR